MKEKRMTKRERKAKFGYGVMSPLDKEGLDKFGNRMVIHTQGVLHRGRMLYPKKVWPAERRDQDYHINKLIREREVIHA